MADAVASQTDRKFPAVSSIKTSALLWSTIAKITGKRSFHPLMDPFRVIYGSVLIRSEDKPV